MKGIYLIVTIFLVSWSVITAEEKDSDKNQAVATSVEFIAKKDYNNVARTVEANKCPDRNPGNTTILLPHEYDCTKFYICLGRQKIERDCPYMNKKGDRLHFNPRRKVCDWPDLAGCDDKDSDEHQHETVTKQLLPDEGDGLLKYPTKCPAKDPNDTTILLPHEYDCTKFYMCHAGKKILKVCPVMDDQGNRLHFNPRLHVCDWPDQAGCESRSTHPTRHTDHTRSTKPTRPTRHTDHTRSTRSTWHTRHTDHTRTTEPTWPTRPPPKDECSWDNDGLKLPHECSCSKYYICVKGNKILRECPDGRYFSKKYQDCVKLEDSDCDGKKPPPKCTKEGELIPHECDCTKYYKCRKNDRVLQECDKGLHFSPKDRKCEDPDIAGCDGDGDEDHSGDCPKPVPEYPWRHECDCRLFYKCENGKKHLYECPWGYYFDKKKNLCAPQEHITDCKNRWDD